jgi:hypothetical protein
VRPVGVTHEKNLATGIAGHRNDQEGKKLRPQFGVRHRVGQLARLVVYPAIHDVLLVLSRCGDLGLSADLSRCLWEYRGAMDLHFVRVNQRDFGIVVDCFFSVRATSG